MKDLTEKQKNMLNFIENFQKKEGMAPTVYEIAGHFQIKTSTVFAHIRALQRKNKLTRSNKARSIVLNNAGSVNHNGSNVGAIPLINALKHGIMPVEQAMERELMVDMRLLGKVKVEKLFAIRIGDDSMRDLGVYEDDMAIVEQEANLRSGDLVVVLIDGKAQLKSFYPLSGDRMELRSANPDFVTEVYRAEDVCIMGKLVGSMRVY